jgi:hypothetical protein
MIVVDTGSDDRSIEERRASAAGNLEAAAQDLRQTAATLRQAIADGSVPASTEEIVTRIEEAAARARMRLLDDDGSVGPGES